MSRTPWALALLALSLPAPALSEPLPGLSLRDGAWNRMVAVAPSRPIGSDRHWRVYAWVPQPEAFIATPPPLWRQRTTYGPIQRDVYGSSDPYGGRYVVSPTRADGDWPSRRTPLAGIQAVPRPLRRCGPGPALVGAAIGGGLGAALSDGSRSRQWALPIGATVGGLLGGVLAGC